MTGTGGVKELQYKEFDLLILDVLGKEDHSIESLDGDDSGQTDETVADKQRAELPTSVLRVDTPSPSAVTDDNRNTYIHWH
jgi:hypothetical protein